MANAQILSTTIDAKAASILAEVDSWDFITAEGRRQVKQLCVTYQAATAADLLSGAPESELTKLFEDRLSDLNLLKDTIRAQIEEARNCEWLRTALASPDVASTQTVSGAKAGCGPSRMAN